MTLLLQERRIFLLTLSCKAIIKKLAVKFEGNEILSVDDFDIFACYQDLWKTKSEKRDAI